MEVDEEDAGFIDLIKWADSMGLLNTLFITLRLQLKQAHAIFIHITRLINDSFEILLINEYNYISIFNCSLGLLAVRLYKFSHETQQNHLLSRLVNICLTQTMLN